MLIFQISKKTAHPTIKSLKNQDFSPLIPPLIRGVRGDQPKKK